MEAEAFAAAIYVLMIVAGCICLVMGILGLRARPVPPDDPEVPVDVVLHVKDTRRIYWALIFFGPIAIVLGIVFLAL